MQMELMPCSNSKALELSGESLFELYEEFVTWLEDYVPIYGGWHYCMSIGQPTTGPEFAKRVTRAKSLVEKAEAADWDFAQVPELFSRPSKADVIAKELAYVHDGETQSIIGNITMAGVGRRFNLLGPIQPDTYFRIKPTTLIADLNRQLGSNEVDTYLANDKYSSPVEVEFHNYTEFLTLRDMVFWHLVNDVGCFPTALEHMKRHFAMGEIIQNNVFDYPYKLKHDDESVHVMQTRCQIVTRTTPVVEWMERPLFGNLDSDTFHLEYLLTLKPSKAAHPYLPLAGEGEVDYGGVRWHFRKFVGKVHKQGLRGPEVPSESSPL